MHRQMLHNSLSMTKKHAENWAEAELHLWALTVKDRVLIPSTITAHCFNWYKSRSIHLASSLTATYQKENDTVHKAGQEFERLFTYFLAATLRMHDFWPKLSNADGWEWDFRWLPISNPALGICTSLNLESREVYRQARH